MAHLGQIDRRNPGDVVFTRYITENADWNKLKIRIENGQFAEMFEDKNIKIVVDKKSFLYLIGTTLEYSGGLNGTGFVFSNPNANRTCGCGESFSL